jgi:translation initiation factor IF-2
MQQRRLRLGDIVDDYCPRERRITNHAVVAMIEDAVKQTRCTTCDADHEYKEAKVPAQRRRKDASPPPAGDAPTATPRKRPAAEAPPVLEAAAEPESIAEPFDADLAPAADPVEAAAHESFDTSDLTDESAAEDDPEDDDGPVHRPLIRATLPRPEGQVPERKEPEFTAHQRSDVNGNRHGRGGQRRGSRPGQGRGPQGGGMGPARFGTGSSRNGGQGPRQGTGFGQRHGSQQGQRQNSSRPGQPHRGGQGRPGGGGGGRKRGR